VPLRVERCRPLRWEVRGQVDLARDKMAASFVAEA
jgi:hypothetical protein